MLPFEGRVRNCAVRAAVHFNKQIEREQNYDYSS